MALGRTRADLLLLLAAFIWGTGFIAQNRGNELMAAASDGHALPVLFTGVRYSLGAILVLAFMGVRSMRRAAPPPADTNESRTLRRRFWLGGTAAGVAMFVASVLQQQGLVTATVTNGGFITSLYVIFVPFIAAMLGQRIGGQVWVATALALIGLYLLSVVGVPQINSGDIWILGCALVWSVQVLVIGWAAPGSDPFALSVLQFAITGVLALATAPLLEPVSFAAITNAIWPILYSAVFAVAIAFTLQVVAQREAPPSDAAIIMAMESVFAALCGWLMLGEPLGPRQWAGGALMLGAAALVQWQPRPRPAPPH